MVHTASATFNNLTLAGWFRLIAILYTEMFLDKKTMEESSILLIRICFQSNNNMLLIEEIPVMQNMAHTAAATVNNLPLAGLSHFIAILCTEMFLDMKTMDKVIGFGRH